MSPGTIEQALPGFLARCRWFAGKAGRLRSVRILDLLTLADRPLMEYLAIIEVEDGNGRTERYLLPLACAFGRRASAIKRSKPALIVSPIRGGPNGDVSGVLFDAFGDDAFNRALLEAFAKRRRLHGRVGEARAQTTRVFRRRHAASSPRRRAPSSGAQSNSTLIIGERVFLKLYRRLTRGVHPEIEVGRFLTERAHFPFVAPTLGVLEYSNGMGPTTLAFLQRFVPSEGDAWSFALASLEKFLQGARGDPAKAIPSSARGFLKAIHLLGRRTAELHRALSGDSSVPAFAPEPFTAKDQRRLMRSMQQQTRLVFQRLRSSLPRLPASLRAKARRVLGLHRRVIELSREILRSKISVPRIRCHGDYHLRQVLRSKGDYIITDFEGEPGRPVSDRRVKHCALRDVASMLRSFDYVAEAAGARFPSKDAWVRAWLGWVYAAFLDGYFQEAREAHFLPCTSDESSRLLEFYLLEKAVYELGGELDYRPDWSAAPLKGILRLVEERGQRTRRSR